VALPPVGDPRSRGLCGVAIWLLRELRRRTPAEFGARKLFAEQGGWIAPRLLARLLIGFGYVGLIVFIREQLQKGGAPQAND
jgi:hypothetical protein